MAKYPMKQILMSIGDFEQWEDLIRSWPHSRSHVIVIDQWCILALVSCTPKQAVFLSMVAAGPLWPA